jgi:hypothetical protein
MRAERRTVVKGHLIIAAAFIYLAVVGSKFSTGLLEDILGAICLLSFPATGIWSAIGVKKEAGFSICFALVLWVVLCAIEFLRFHFFDEDPYGWSTAYHILFFFIVPATISFFYFLGVLYGRWRERRVSAKVLEQ